MPKPLCGKHHCSHISEPGRGEDEQAASVLLDGVLATFRIDEEEGEDSKQWKGSDEGR